MKPVINHIGLFCEFTEQGMQPAGSHIQCCVVFFSTIYLNRFEIIICFVNLFNNTCHRLEVIFGFVNTFNGAYKPAGIHIWFCKYF